jgi:cyclase
MRTRLENVPDALVVANTAGTPAKRCVPANAREISVTRSPAAHPPAAEPNTRVCAPGETCAGLTCSDAALAAVAGRLAAATQTSTVVAEPHRAPRLMAGSLPDSGAVHYKRVIPCMDVDAGRVVKGTRFIDIRDAGDPVGLAAHYDAEGADELVFLDITATSDKRATVVELARRAADEVFVPFTIGGGVRDVADAQAVLDAGADKVSVNSAVVARPDLIDELAQVFGAQCVVLAIDAKRAAAGWEVYVAGGRTATGRDALAWAREGVERGAGEILLTSMDRDGTQDGYDLALLEAISSAVDVPVIASGGAGEPQHLVDGLQAGADAVLCASIFHYGQYTVGGVKDALASAGVPVRRIS